MSEFDALLRLQDHDVRLEQLEHRLVHLPERKVVEDNALALVALEASAEPARTRRDELGREQKRLEDEVAAVDAKAADVHHKLYETGITSPKELQALEADHASLKRRQTELEDHVLELMEAVEPVDAQLEVVAEQRSLLDQAGQAASIALAEAIVAAEAELAQARAERDGIVAEVPADQLASYEELRPSFAGIAVARLVGSNCSGCHLTLSSMALAQLRKLPPGTVAHCDECGRILVR